MSPLSAMGPVLLVSALLQACNSADAPMRIVGQLESDRIEIAADAAEPIVRMHVVEGQEVARGELLLNQDSSRINARLAEARASLAQSRARLDELTRGPRDEQIAAARASVAGARREADFRRSELQRVQRLLEQDLASRESVDRARAALDAAIAQLEVLEARLRELLEGTTSEELRQAENAVRRVEAQLALLEVDARRLDVLAPVEGTVDSILIEPGERPAVGQPMVILLSGAQPYARVYIPEPIRVSVTPGTAARIFIDGRREALSGRVRWVSAEAAFTPYFALTERNRSRLSFAAKIDIEETQTGERLPDGVPLEVEFPGIGQSD